MKTGNGMHYAEAPLEPSRSANGTEAGASIIANLSSNIRDELNYRISDGDPGIELVDWLNSKPEVVEVVNKLFDGTPISEQNLSEWRKRGYQKWLAHRNMFDESNALGDNAEVIAETGIDCDKLLLTLTAAYAEAIQNWIITPGEQMLYKLAVYKNLTNGVIALQRAELQKVRLEIDRERLELLREKRRDKSAEAIGRGSEPYGEGAGGGPGKGRAVRPACPGKGRASASSGVSASADSASPEGAASSSPTCPEASEPGPSETPAPPPCEKADSLREPPPADAGSLPASEESPATPATVGSIPRSADEAAASPTPAPTPSTPAPQPKPSAASAPALVSSAGSIPTTTHTAALQPLSPPASSPKPAAPQNAPMWPTRRPGGAPHNASPRNPLGLL
jgi:hypothetical protein